MDAIEIGATERDILTSLSPADVASPAPSLRSGLLLASLLLPLAPSADAETAPEKASLQLKYLDYLDSQPGADRIRVRAPMLMLSIPFKDEWLLNTSLVNDTVSGASPRYHTKALTKMFDVRNAVSASVTHLYPERAETLGIAKSKERDYESSSVSATHVWFLNGKNTEVTLGASYTYDSINPANRLVVDEHKQIIDLITGVTQILTTADILQLTLRYSDGNGYYNDPYKSMDQRPRHRQAQSLLSRWNHYWDAVGGTSRISYRYYTDSFGIDAHTINLEYVQPLAHGWNLMPLLRLYTQNAASFYVPSDPAQPNLPIFPDPTMRYYSEDQRLSAFGARTIGAKLSKQINRDLLVDVKIEKYDQRSGWALQGKPDEGLLPFSARSLQVGFNYQF